MALETEMLVSGISCSCTIDVLSRTENSIKADDCRSVRAIRDHGRYESYTNESRRDETRWA